MKWKTERAKSVWFKVRADEILKGSGSGGGGGGEEELIDFCHLAFRREGER